MIDKEKLTKQFKLVKMNEIDITTDEFNIIGTQGLGSCVAFLVYSEKNKVAIVSHIPDNNNDIFSTLLEIIYNLNLNNELLKYHVIPGYYENGYKIYEKLVMQFKSMPNIFIPFEYIPENAINIDEFSTSYEFAFDALTGKFVTDKVLFGYAYKQIHSNKKSK